MNIVSGIKAVPSTLLLAIVLASAGGGSLRADDEALQVTIERAPFIVRPAASYDIPLKLVPARQVTIVALGDGLVQPVRVKPGDKVTTQSELVRLDGRILALEVERATAAVQLAKEQVGLGGAGALRDVAEKDLELAKLRLDQSISRMPWDGVVLAVHAAEGAFVRWGDPLVTVADPTMLFVDVPINRAEVAVGEDVELKVEDVTVLGKLAAVQPLAERLDPLRSLFASIASGRVEIDNAEGRYIIGQTVYSPMIPRHPVGEVPTAAISNAADSAEGAARCRSFAMAWSVMCRSRCLVRWARNTSG
ncbi:MAG: HlyD family efflux transporter periplasmic adaptor subunit [Planctomycetaceae bacterium]